MGSTVEGIQHDHIVLLLDYCPFPELVFHFSQVDDAHELGILIVVVDYGAGRIVPGLQMFEEEVSDSCGQVAEGGYLFEIHREEVLFVGSTGVLVADLRDGHEFGLVVAVHEVDEAFLFDEPLGEVVVFGLGEVHGLGVGVAIGWLFGGFAVFDREGLEFCLVVASPDFGVEDIEEAEGLFHLINLIGMAEN
jgi:hypothetical protein